MRPHYLQSHLVLDSDSDDNAPQVMRFDENVVRMDCTSSLEVQEGTLAAEVEVLRNRRSA